MKDTARIITIACDADQGYNLIRQTMTIEEAILAHVTFERSRLLAGSSDAVSAAGETH